MPTRPRLFTCPACGRTRVTQVRGDLCFSCYDCGRPHERRRVTATCSTCGQCGQEVEAPYSFWRMRTCPRCYSRGRKATFVCGACGREVTQIPQAGECSRCARLRRKVRVATCTVCGQTRRTEFSRQDVCKACQTNMQSRQDTRQAGPKSPAGVRVVHAAGTEHLAAQQRVRPTGGQEVLHPLSTTPSTTSAEREAHLLSALAPLRRAWVREFLATGYRTRSPEMRRKLLVALRPFDRYLTEETPTGEGQWMLVTAAQVRAYLATHAPRARTFPACEAAGTPLVQVSGKTTRRAGSAGHMAERSAGAAVTDTTGTTGTTGTTASRWTRLTSARAFLRWLHTRKHCGRLDDVIPDPRRRVRLRMLSVEQVRALYQRWTVTTDEAAAGDKAAGAVMGTGDNVGSDMSSDMGSAGTNTVDRPAEALVGLLALVHCLSAEEIRFLRLADVLAPDRLRVSGRGASGGQGSADVSARSERGREVELAPSVAAALARYLSWRRLMYGGPSTYVLVSRASRLHDRPVSASWLHSDLLPGTPVASLRQSAIQRLIQEVGCDGLQLAAYTARSLQTVQTYLHIFHRPAPAECKREDIP